MTRLFSRLTAACLCAMAIHAGAATNNVVTLDITGQRAAVNPVTKEVAFIRDSLVVIGYDVDARKTNWVLQPQRGNPNRLAFSSDGAYLFIGMPGSNGVWQVNAATREPVRFILTGRVTSIMPIASQPDSIVTFTGVDSGAGLIAVWEAGVRRNATINNAIYPTLYGNKVYYRTNLNLNAATVGPEGLTVETSQRAYSGFPTWMTASEKWLIDGHGIVHDRANLNALGRLPFAPVAASMLAFEDADRLLCTYVSTNTQINAFRLSNLQFLGGFRVTQTVLSGSPLEFVKLGTNRTILLGVRPMLVEPMAFAATRADLGVSTAVTPEPIAILGDFAVTITVTNRGPDAATGVKLTNQLSGASRLSVTASQGNVVNSEARSVAELGTIPAGGSARVTVMARADEPRFPANTSSVTANEPDPDTTDDAVSLTMRTIGPTSERRERIYPIDVAGLAALDNSKKLYATTDALAGKIGNAVLRINPTTGAIEQTTVVGMPLGKIAVSADQQFAYVSPLNWSNFARVNLSSGAVEWAPTAGQVGEIQRMPGDSKVAVTAGASVYLFDGVTSLPKRATASSGVTGVGPGELFTGVSLYSAGLDGFNFERTYPNYSDFSANRVLHDHWVFGSNGSVLDLENGEYVRGDYGSGLMAINRSERRVYYAPYTDHTLRVRDADTQTEIATVYWFGINTVGANWPEAFAAGDGFAAASVPGRLMTVESKVFSNNGEQDLAVTFEALNEAFAGHEVTYRVVVRNKPATAAADSVLTIALSTNLAPLRVEMPGSMRTNQFTVSVNLPDLAPGQSMTGLVTALALRAGTFKSTAYAAGLSRDATPEDNAATLLTAVRIQPATDTRYDLEGDFGILAKNPKTGRFISASSRFRPEKGPHEIDPITGAVTQLNLPLPVAASMSISDDGSHLFALTADMRNVIVINLATGAESGRIALNYDGYKVAALPGASNGFVLGSVSNIVVFDGTTPRLITLPSFGPGFTDFAVSEDGRWVYGVYEDIVTWMEVTRNGLDAQGYTTVFANINGLARLRTQKGLLFTNHGQVGEPKRKKLLGEFSELGWISPFVPDLESGKIYRIYSGLEIYDAQTHRLLATHSLNDRMRNGLDLFRFGGDGLLLYSEEGITLIRTSLIGSAPAADVAITIEPVSIAKDRVEYQIELRNHSTSNAANVRTLAQFPENAAILFAPEGATDSTNGLSLRRRTLAPGERAIETIAIKPPWTPFIARAQVLTDARESVTWNNWDATLTSANLMNRFEETINYPIPAAEIAGLTNGNLCVVTGPEAGPGLENRYFVLDPTAGRIVGKKLFLGYRPNKVVTHWFGGTHAFVTTYPEGVIHRVDLASNSVDLTREIPGGNYVFDVSLPHPTWLFATSISYGPSGTNFSSLYFLQDQTIQQTALGILYLSNGPRYWGNGSAGLCGVRLDGSLDKLREFIGFTDIHVSTHSHVFAENGFTYLPIQQESALPVASISLDPVWDDRLYALTNDQQYYTIRAYRPFDMYQYDIVLAGGPVDGARFTTNLVRHGMAGLAFRTDKHIKVIRSAVVPVAAGDADQDGLQNEFEWRYGLNPVVPDADGDLDGDGASNRLEFAAGTSPNEAESVFQITPLRLSDTQIHLQFKFVQGKRYQVLRRERLESGAWEVIQENTWPAPFHIIDMDTGGANAFYAIKLLP